MPSIFPMLILDNPDNPLNSVVLLSTAEAEAEVEAEAEAEAEAEPEAEAEAKAKAKAKAGGPPTAKAKAEAKAGGGFSRPTKQDPSNEPTSLSVFALYITVSVCCSVFTSLRKYTQPLEASVGAAQETQARVVMAWGQTSRKKAPSAPPEEKQAWLSVPRGSCPSIFRMSHQDTTSLSA